MQNLLFLIADTGGGHRASANAVAEQLHATHPGRFDIRIVDPFAASAPRAVSSTTLLYGPLTRHARWAWGALYHMTNTRSAVALLMSSVIRLVEPGIRKELQRFSPSAVISFHPLLNHPAIRAARKIDPRTPVLTVITDLVDVHAAWACPEVDAVIVPSPGGFDRCRRAGIPGDRCYDVGLPVGADFTRPLPSAEERAELRHELGLSPGGFVVLVCGGADGSGGIARRARGLAGAGLDIEVAVICGRNQRALNQLRGLTDRKGRRVLVHGFVSNMGDWLRAADVVASKAGPGTIAEALCSGVPLLLTSYIPGQERGNVEWVRDAGAGRYVPRIAQLVDAVAELSAPGSPHMDAMRAAVCQVARPDAAARIAGIITQFADRRAG
jgi:1,2-diacylglycerol 3-beta-galactosyltransferase